MRCDRIGIGRTALRSIFSDRNFDCERTCKHLLNAPSVGSCFSRQKLSFQLRVTLFLDDESEKWNGRFAEQAFPSLKGVCVMVSRIATAIAGLIAVVAAGCSSNPEPSPNGAKPKPAAAPGETPGGSEECDDSALASASVPCKKDADPCNLHSGFRGDEYCILPPPEGHPIRLWAEGATPTAELAKYPPAR